MSGKRNKRNEDRFVLCGERSKLVLQKVMDLPGCGRQIDRRKEEQAWFVALNAFVQTGVYLCPDCTAKHGIVYGRPNRRTSPR